MPDFGGISVDDLDSSRWELALALMQSGETQVRLGEVVMWRSVAGPAADGVICMTVEVSEHASSAIGSAALMRGRRVVDEAASTDPRFRVLLDKHGCRWEVVNNYGMGSVLLGRAEASGPLEWLQ